MLGIVGTLVLLVALVDMAWTTVAVSAGGGPVTTRMAHALWTSCRKLAGEGDRHHRALRIAGVLIVVLTLVSWITLVWVGWSLIFSGAEGAVRNATTKAPATGFERFYFAGYTVLTLGNGELVPGSGIWQAFTVVAAFSGLAVVTMGITYLVPIVSAVVEGRTLALNIASLGTDPHDVLISSWQGGGWRVLEDALMDLREDLMRLGQRHLAYPILHYFHNTDSRAAPAVGVAVLDEALTLLEHGVAEYARPHALAVRSARDGVGSLLGALNSAFIRPSGRTPPVPSLEPLREAGIPTVDDEVFEQAVEGSVEHRRAVCGMLEDDGWSWEVVGSSASDASDVGDEDGHGTQVEQATEQSA